jgi:hypothetical protein
MFQNVHADIMTPCVKTEDGKSIQVPARFLPTGLLPAINSEDLLAVMTELLTDRPPGLAIQDLLARTQCFGYRSAGGRRLPAGKLFIPGLRVGVPKAMKLR